ncbi:hypothetical protein [Shewanella gaetbuli]
MKANSLWLMLVACGLVFAATSHAGVIDPECDAKKAAKSAVAKATVGVGGRCNASEAVKDTAEKVVEDKLPQDGAAGQLVDKATGKDETIKDKAVDAVVPDKLQKNNQDKHKVKKDK